MGPWPRGAGRQPRRLLPLLLLLGLARGATGAQGVDGEYRKDWAQHRAPWVLAGPPRGWARPGRFPAHGPDRAGPHGGAQVGQLQPLGIRKAGFKEAGGAPRLGFPVPAPGPPGRPVLGWPRLRPRGT